MSRGRRVLAPPSFGGPSGSQLTPDRLAHKLGGVPSVTCRASGWEQALSSPPPPTTVDQGQKKSAPGPWGLGGGLTATAATGTSAHRPASFFFPFLPHSLPFFFFLQITENIFSFLFKKTLLRNSL